MYGQFIVYKQLTNTIIISIHVFFDRMNIFVAEINAFIACVYSQITSATAALISFTYKKYGTQNGHLKDSG